MFPDAEVKVYLDADLETRARRRSRELQERGIGAPLEQVLIDLERRDARDRGRADSPLRPPEGALVIDSSGLTITDQVEAVIRAVRAHPGCPRVEEPR